MISLNTFKETQGFTMDRLLSLKSQGLIELYSKEALDRFAKDFVKKGISNPFMSNNSKLKETKQALAELQAVTVNALGTQKTFYIKPNMELIEKAVKGEFPVGTKRVWGNSIYEKQESGWHYVGRAKAKGGVSGGKNHPENKNDKTTTEKKNIDTQIEEIRKELRKPFGKTARGNSKRGELKERLKKLLALKDDSKSNKDEGKKDSAKGNKSYTVRYSKENDTYQVVKNGKLINDFSSKEKAESFAEKKNIEKDDKSKNQTSIPDKALQKYESALRTLDANEQGEDIDVTKVAKARKTVKKLEKKYPNIAEIMGGEPGSSASKKVEKEEKAEKKDTKKSARDLVDMLMEEAPPDEKISLQQALDNTDAPPPAREGHGLTVFEWLKDRGFEFKEE